MVKNRMHKSGRTSLKEWITSIVDKYPHHILSAILFSALILRVSALLNLRESIYFDYLLWDERLYHAWAARIADGTFQSSTAYEMAPLPAYFMALIYKMFSPNVIYFRIVNIIFGVITCLLVYLIGRDIAGRTMGLLSCFVASFYKPFVFYNIVPLKTSLSVFLFALMCYLLVSIMGKESMIKTFLLGIAIGLASNVRPNCLILVPVILLLFLWHAYKSQYTLKAISMLIVLYTAGFVVVQSPFMIRNIVVGDEYTPTPTQSGFNLFMCNNLEYSYPLPFASTAPGEMGIQFTIEASRRAGKKLTSREASRYWTREVVKTIIEQPAAFVWKKCRDTAILFNWFERGDHYQIDFISDYVKFFRLPLFNIWLIIPFGMAGILINLMNSRKKLVLSAIFIIYALTLVVFFTNTRVRLPLLVILIPFSVIGFSRFISYFKDGRVKNAMVYSTIVILFLIIEFLPVRDSNDMTAYQNTHAIILNSKGLTKEAIQYWEISSEADKQYSDFANLSLAGNYLKKGHIGQARHYINKISDHSFAAAYKYDMTGDMMMRKKDITRAINAYKKSIEINSGLRRPRLKMIKLLVSIDRAKALEEINQLEYINSFYILYGLKREMNNLKNLTKKGK